jgi:hypothetical protein
MKKNKIIISIAIILAALAVYLILNKTGQVARKELRDFTVKDTSSITKFFIADRSGHSVTLEKQDDNNWTVNKKYEARRDGINLLLDACMKMKVRTHVAKSAYNTTIKSLATTGIKCEIYQDNSLTPSKIYYVGGSTQDVLGTYMMLENSSVPFVVEIPGFNGYLTPRYSAMEKDWRATTVFRYQPDEIKSISLVYPNTPENSFVIEKNGSSYHVTSPFNNRTLQEIDTLRLINYLEHFNSLHFEGWDRELTKEQQDSVFHATPATVITVTDINGKSNFIKVYPKKAKKDSLVESSSPGDSLKYDVERMYAFMNDQNELFTIQQYVFGKIFARFSDFDLALNRKLIHKRS